ncbi:protein phosphatase 2C domain-containing protein [Anthocerotibacter panamensis]|uniref:protein phosphatase 2C domain-containing protein n=1 Tax=Anthocerotibacter panamensis TaxID=2857077 RepID=UPI001C4052C9|nr:protein phosphatase 2C domain-containing protein [Anthocerotibacter panamensis]
MYYLVTGNPQPLPVGRYQPIGPAVVHDTRPDLPLEPAPETLPVLCRPYQRLNAFRWAVPEVHACLGPPGQPWVLLGSAPLDECGQPWPTLLESWANASVLMQVGWLMQVARLWDPCVQEGVAQSLLDPQNLGVQGWHLKLFYLRPTPEAPILCQLGHSWQKLLHPDSPLSKVVEQMVEGSLLQAQALISVLEALVVATGRVTAIVGTTHPGNRANNEDTYLYDPQGRYGIVCDGMGGHEGGEVASALALTSLKEHLAYLCSTLLTPLQMRQGLAEAIYRTNQQLVNRNRSERRSRYQQMGTTVVAYCLTGALLHITHVGDSRIYLIDRTHCQQLTVDDDIANLEVSLAHTTTFESLSLSNSGALTQALGVTTNQSLLPTVQTFVLAEDCLLLLCSDGLCDGALVERSWRTMLRPLLEGALTTQGILDLALRELGHDNITFILSRYTPCLTMPDRGSVAGL